MQSFLFTGALFLCLNCPCKKLRLWSAGMERIYE